MGWGEKGFHCVVHRRLHNSHCIYGVSIQFVRSVSLSLCPGSLSIVRTGWSRLQIFLTLYFVGFSSFSFELLERASISLIRLFVLAPAVPDGPSGE